MVINGEQNIMSYKIRKTMGSDAGGTKRTLKNSGFPKVAQENPQTLKGGEQKPDEQEFSSEMEEYRKAIYNGKGRIEAIYESENPGRMLALFQNAAGIPMSTNPQVFALGPYHNCDRAMGDWTYCTSTSHGLDLHGTGWEEFDKLQKLRKAQNAKYVLDVPQDHSLSRLRETSATVHQERDDVADPTQQYHVVMLELYIRTKTAELFPAENWEEYARFPAGEEQAERAWLAEPVSGGWAIFAIDRGLDQSLNGFIQWYGEQRDKKGRELTPREVIQIMQGDLSSPGQNPQESSQEPSGQEEMTVEGKNILIGDLMKLANHFDSEGLSDEADYLDNVMRKMALESDLGSSHSGEDGSQYLATGTGATGVTADVPEAQVGDPPEWAMVKVKKGSGGNEAGDDLTFYYRRIAQGGELVWASWCMAPWTNDLSETRVFYPKNGGAKTILSRKSLDGQLENPPDLSESWMIGKGKYADITHEALTVLYHKEIARESEFAGQGQPCRGPLTLPPRDTDDGGDNEAPESADVAGTGVDAKPAGVEYWYSLKTTDTGEGSDRWFGTLNCGEQHLIFEDVNSSWVLRGVKVNDDVTDMFRGTPEGIPDWSSLVHKPWDSPENAVFWTAENAGHLTIGCEEAEVQLATLMEARGVADEEADQVDEEVALAEPEDGSRWARYVKEHAERYQEGDSRDNARQEALGVYNAWKSSASSLPVAEGSPAFDESFGSFVKWYKQQHETEGDAKWQHGVPYSEVASKRDNRDQALWMMRASEVPGALQSLLPDQAPENNSVDQYLRDNVWAKRNGKDILPGLLSLATHLDKSGHMSEADYLDSIVNKIAQSMSEAEPLVGEYSSEDMRSEMAESEDMDNMHPHDACEARAFTQLGYDENSDFDSLSEDEKDRFNEMVDSCLGETDHPAVTHPHTLVDLEDPSLQVTDEEGLEQSGFEVNWEEAEGIDDEEAGFLNSLKDLFENRGPLG